MKRLMAYIEAVAQTADELTAAAVGFEDRGADGIVICHRSADESSREAFYEQIKKVTRAIDIPVMTGCRVKRFEDSKKAFYTGAEDVILYYGDIKGTTLYKESADRFGADHIYVEIGTGELGDRAVMDELEALGCRIVINTGADGSGVRTVVFDGTPSETITAALSDGCDMAGLLADESVSGVASAGLGEDGTGIMELKASLKAAGIDVNTYIPDISFADLKKGPDGLVPCIVQDYRDGAVLMMAYMDEEAFTKTVTTGIMTYHSRSRNELWVKGLTSGHFQYLKELSLDCDSDTLLAKVRQVGAACHTGSRSCFFNTLVRHGYAERDIQKVLKSLYEVVVDRREHPKEGSYTNYLFDKGIDKILKKCGEEATEMVIAAKNPNAEELKYEIADLLYHMTVLMVECGVDWEDVASELANR